MRSRAASGIIQFARRRIRAGLERWHPRPGAPGIDRRKGGCVSSTLSDQDLQLMLELVRDADSVEVKLTIPENTRATTVAGLGADPLDAQVRPVF